MQVRLETCFQGMDGREDGGGGGGGGGELEGVRSGA